MTDEERFDVVLSELGHLLVQLGDLARHVTLIGGQVPSLLGKANGGTGVISVATATGVELTRAFSFEPDLLIDVEGLGFQHEQLPLTLRHCGFERTRPFRWAKQVGEVFVEVDLFAPPGADPELAPTVMTALPGGDIALLRPERITFRTASGEYEIAVPSPTAFLAMKLEAKRKLRPGETKDSFDMYSYVRLVGVGAVVKSLSEHGADGVRVRDALRTLFRTIGSTGVVDVLSFAANLLHEEQQLVARDVVDTFEAVRATRGAGQ